MTKDTKVRLGDLLVRQGFVRGERGAFLVVTEGRVLVNGQKAVSPAQMVDVDDAIEVRPEREFVGRGAYKLEAAIEKFGIDVRGLICVDIGAATGGFTEVLLKRGAAKVYAVDAGRGKLDLKLRQDPRVVVMEETNVLAVPPLSEPVGLIAIDVSFTSLTLVLPKIRSWLSEQGRVIALFKPQYEARDPSLLRHGVVRDPQTRERLLTEFRAWLLANAWRELGCMESPIRGSKGNVEYLFYLSPL